MTEKQNVFLDLDNTIICSVIQSKISDYDLNKLKSLKMHTMAEDYYIFERPYLQTFLTYLFKNFNVSVWTAASRDYASFIIENVILSKPDRTLDFFFWNVHCHMSEKKYGRCLSKDLSLLWEEYGLTQFNSMNTLIIDDYGAKVFDGQPCNCLLAEPFEISSFHVGTDNYLQRAQRHLKKIKSGEINNDMCLIGDGVECI